MVHKLTHFLCHFFCFLLSPTLSSTVGTLIGAILGSPFGTVIYVGHPVHKRVGAQTGYSIMNGFIYLILCLAGVIPTILSIIPVVAIGPIILIFGIMICEGRYNLLKCMCK